MSVRRWLVALTAVAMLPAFIFSLLLIERNNRAQETALSTLAVIAARSKADAVDRQLNGMLTTMRVFAALRSLRRNDWETFHATATAGLRGSRTFLIVARDGHRQLVNTMIPFGEPLSPLTQSEFYTAALESGRFAVSGALPTPTGNWAYVVAMPLDPQAGEARLILSGQSLDALWENFVKDGIGGEWEAALVDRDGVVLASTVSETEIGKPFFLPTAAVEYGRVERIDLGNRSYDVVSQRSELAGWSVKIWADAAALRRPLHRTYRALLLGGLAMMAAALLAAYFLGRQVSASVRILANDAVRMGQGEDIHGRSTPVTELSAVSAALAEASRSRRASENEIRFLLREVAHRSKNQLTVIASLAKQSADGADTVEEFGESFQQRILGLSRSTDLLLAGSSSGVDLGELLRTQVEPFKPEYAASLSLEGPPVRLEAQAAQMFGLVFHELATNAAKHGAFSAPDGRIDATWSVEDGRLRLNWRETGARLVSPPVKRGFGTRLLIRTINSALRGEAKSTYHPDGLEVDLTVPLEGVRQLAEG